MSPFAERFGWVLVHSLWQFTLVAAVAALLCGALRRHTANVRYVVLLLALMTIVAAPVVTWFGLTSATAITVVAASSAGDDARSPNDRTAKNSESNARSRALAERARREAALDNSEGAAPRELSPAAPSDDTDRVLEPSADVPPAGLTQYFDPQRWNAQVATWLSPWLHWIVSGWCLGVGLGSLRPLVGWRTLRRLRHQGRVPANTEIRAAADRMAQRLGLRRAVEVSQSTLTTVPVLVGYLRPIVLLPVGLAANLPLAQLEAILAHELAHVARHDFVINLLQTFIETLGFYHPAVWWISRRLRIEREHCCDDHVVRVLNNRVDYGRALVAVEELRGHASALALGVTDGSLLARVKRIVNADTPRSSPRGAAWSLALVGLVAVGLTLSTLWAQAPTKEKPTEPAPKESVVVAKPAAEPARSVDWPMWGGSPQRNHVAAGRLPTEWQLGTKQNVRWSAPLGDAVYASPVVADGKVFVGTNNSAGLDPRRPGEQDFACLVCFDQTTGARLWQYASEKMADGRIHDWPRIGLCSTPCVVGDRLYVVTNRCEVVCLDTRGFRDDENDGLVVDEREKTLDDADVVWKFDVFGKLGVRPLHQAVSSVVVVDQLVLFNTSNGSDESYTKVPAPDAPHFVALDARNGQVVWQDNSAGEAIVVGGSSCGCSGTSPAVASIGGVTQAIFAGREGWLYGFDFAELKQGRTRRLWQFDGNPKESVYQTGGRSTRNTIVSSPVVVGDRVYVATGRNPEEGEGAADLWCIDATKRGDLSPELVFNPAHRNGTEPIPHKPLCACDPKAGDFTRPNPNAGAVWHYTGRPAPAPKKPAFTDAFHRTVGSPVIHDGLLWIADFSGVLHCVDALTGEGLWTHDLMAACWSSCVVADGHVVIGDEDGDLAIYKASRRAEPLRPGPLNLGMSLYGTPALVGDTMFVAGPKQIYAIQATPPKPAPGANDDAANRATRKLTQPAVRLPDHWIVKSVAWDAPGKTLMTLSIQGGMNLRKWDVAGQKLLSELKLVADTHGETCREATLQFSRDRRHVLAATDTYVGIWDVASGKLVRKLSIPKMGNNDTIYLLDATPDLSRVVGCLGTKYERLTLSFDAHTVVWNGTTGEVLRTIVHPRANDLRAISLASDGRTLCTTSGGDIGVWDVATGESRRTISIDNSKRRHPDPEVTVDALRHVWSLRCAPDGRQIAVGDMLGVNLVDARTGELVKQLDGPYRYGVGELVFSDDGRQLARLGTSLDAKDAGTVVVWSTETGERLVDLSTSSGAAAFSPDGNALAVGFSDLEQALTVWELRDLPDAERTRGPGPHSRQDRVEENGHYVGARAAEFAQRFAPTWSEARLGIHYGVALTSQAARFSAGQRVPFVYFFRNAGDRPVKIDTSPDYLGNAPQVRDANGAPVTVEVTKVLGPIPHYVETLGPGEVLGPFYANVALGENPLPLRQHWSPVLSVAAHGKYTATHSVSIKVSSPTGENVQQTTVTSPPQAFEIGDAVAVRTNNQKRKPQETVALATLIQNFNAKVARLGQGGGEPPLDEAEVIGVIRKGDWKKSPHELNEQEIAAFRAIAESRRVSAESYLHEVIEDHPETFVYSRVWRVYLMIPAIGHDGFVGLTLRDKKIADEKIDPEHVAWGTRQADGLTLGVYISPRKASYAWGERVRLRLFVRNDSQQAVRTSWANSTHPMPEDFVVTDAQGAAVGVAIGHGDWHLPWLSGYTGSSIEPAEVHAFRVPFELQLGGNAAANELVGRILACRGGQTLKLKVRAPTGGEADDQRRDAESGALPLTIQAPPPGTKGKNAEESRNASAATRETLLSFLGGDERVPLAGLRVAITSGHGSDQRHFGAYTTDLQGAIRVHLPVGFYYLRLSSSRELPFLPVEAFWNKQSRGPRPELCLNVTADGAEKWLDGKLREKSDQVSSQPAEPTRITYTLLPACELVLRAVDAETGAGLTGVSFYTENAVGEDWAHPIDGENLGSRYRSDVAVQNSALVTNQNGVFTRLIGANAGFSYGVARAPEGYEEAKPGGEVNIDVVYGQRRAEHVFKFRRVRPAAADGAKPTDAQRTTGTLQGRFVVDGERPQPVELAPELLKLEADSPPPRDSEGRYLGTAAMYQSYLKHKIRPSTVDASLQVGAEGGVANILVWALSRDIPWQRDANDPPTPVTLRVRGGAFEPRVTVLVPDQQLLIENHDPLTAHMSLSPLKNESWNTLLAPNSVDNPYRRTFANAEVMPCIYRSNLMPWTEGIIFVHANPYVGVSNERGEFKIEGLPAGDWEFRAWHERLGYLRFWPKGKFQQTIQAGANDMGTIKLKPEFLARPGGAKK